MSQGHRLRAEDTDVTCRSVNQGHRHRAEDTESTCPSVTTAVCDCAAPSTRSVGPRPAFRRRMLVEPAKSLLDSGLDSGYLSSHLTDESLSQRALSVSEALDSGPPPPQKQQPRCPKEASSRLDSGLDLTVLNKDLDQLNISEAVVSDEERRVLEDCYVTKLTKAFRGDEDGDTYLHLAIIYGYRELAHRLIRFVPHPNFFSLRNSYLQTPLHLAVLSGDADLTRTLVVAGAELGLRDKHGDTPLHLACRDAGRHTLPALVEPVTANELATAGVRYPLPAGSASATTLLDAWNYQGLSCLHLAVRASDQEVAAYLLSHGAFVNVIEGKSGRTPLHLATEQNSIEMVQMLIMVGGADVNSNTYGGLSAYQLAQSNGRCHLAELLLKLGGHRRQVPDSDFDSTDSDSEMAAPQERYGDIRIRGQPVVAVQ